MNVLVGLSLTDLSVNTALAEVAWTPREAEVAGRGAIGLLRVDESLWSDVRRGNRPPRVTPESVWAEATPVFSSVRFDDYQNVSDRSTWQWNLAPNDGGHQPRVLAYELVDLKPGRVSLVPVYADLGTSWRLDISEFRTAAGIRERLSRLKRWPWRRRCVDVVVGDDPPGWKCENRGCTGDCVQIPVDTGASVRLVCECS